MLLNQIVEVSEQLKATRSRTAKIGAIARLLQGRTAHELRTIVAWMSGDLLQGRIGISKGRAHLYGKGVAASELPGLTVEDVERALIAVQEAKGSGSLGVRERLLHDLLREATEAEQRFLVGLLAGELRQGALGGVIIEGIATAAGVAGDVVRRAAMLSGELPAVAVAAFNGGEAALRQIDLKLFRAVLPMLAQTADTPADALTKKAALIFEEKLDGMRLQLHRQGDRVELYSRSLRWMTPSLPEIVAYARALPVDRIILDGEIMRFAAGGAPLGFGAAMDRFGRKSAAPVVEPGEYPTVTPVFFDCLMVDGVSLIDRPIDIRLAALDRITKPPNRVRRLLTGDPEEASAFLQDVLDRGHEGVVAKDPESAYTAGGRGAHWFKIKPAHTLDVVVLGAEWGNGRREGLLSNLHLGVRDEATDTYVMLGKTFKGMTDEILSWQTARLLELETHRDEITVYVRPELVVEVAFAELFPSRRYDSKLAFRFARVLRYRTDKPLEQADTLATAQAIKDGRIRARVGAARREQARPAVTVSNADRVLFPEAGVTKGDVVAHYYRVAPHMLPHLLDRPLTLVRHPRGIAAKGFFQKNVAKHYPEDLIGRIEMPRREGVTVHPAASTADALAYLANQATIEFHIPLATKHDSWRPDRLVIDLDPPEGGGAGACEAAWACKELFDELGIETTPMTTGSKGYHVCARLLPTESMTRTAHKLAAILLQRHPDLLTNEFLKENRGGRVLIDWMRNMGLATVVAPWSLRAREGAPVAMPITWDELNDTAPDAFKINDALDRPDHLHQLTPVDPAPLIEAVDRIIEEQGIELEYIDRFGRRMQSSGSD